MNLVGQPALEAVRCRCTPATTKLRRRFAALASALVVFGVGAGWFAGKAAADPVSDAYAYAYGAIVCDVLDDYPSVGGVQGVVDAIAADGLTYYQAGRVVGLSVGALCPRHLALLDRYIYGGFRA